jgi:hypothetical protein
VGLLLGLLLLMNVIGEGGDTEMKEKGSAGGVVESGSEWFERVEKH